MIIAISSIIIFTIIVWVLNKKLPMQVCAICAGVVFTWIFLFLGMFLGKLPTALYQIPAAILAGGTVVGIMSKLEKFIKSKFILIWKTIFVISGFGAVYGLVESRLAVIVIGVIVSVITTILFKMSKDRIDNQKSEQVKALEEKMKNCC